MASEKEMDKSELERLREELTEEKSKRQESEEACRKLSSIIENVEAATKVMQLLDSDAPIEQIMGEWLDIVCSFLQIETAQIFSLYEDDSHMDVYCEWLAEGEKSFFEKKKNVKSYSFLYTDKPVVLSRQELEEIYEDETASLGIRAVMVFPLLRQENGRSMVLSLNHRREYHFDMYEVQYVVDTARVLQNILVKRLRKNSLISSYASLEEVLDNVGSAVCVADKETGQILFANGKMKNSLGKELQTESFRDFLEKESSETAGKSEKEIYYEENKKWYDFSSKEISWVDGRAVMLYALYDITDKKVYQKRIEQQAHTDFLTGLFNRMCCERDLANLIDEAKINGGTGALLYMDLDDFKHINDALGHMYGDILLKDISYSLRQVKGIENNCYRMGGDEFVILISPKHFPRFESIVEAIKKIFSKPWLLNDTDYYCTMSMGIVTFPDCGESVIELIKKADIAMYEAKKGGKNRVARYSDNVGDSSGRRLDMEKNMRNAAEDDCREFMVYYQPIINVQKEDIECAGAEALIRWNSSNLGFISPAEFIPLAEYLGLINPIGNYVLLEACRNCKKWNDSGYPNYKVNVNLSVVQLLQPDIVEIVERTLKESGINPKNLTLEVTESLAINDMKRMKDILGKIKALGVSLALDDFGTGYSSLNHIREIPFDIIKVDQSFVKELAEDAYAKSFVKMVSELAEAIGMSVCVEGIETLRQYAALQGMKIKYIQGYFFDKPMPKEDFEAKYVQKD